MHGNPRHLIRTLRAALEVLGVLAVPHLHTSEGEPRVVLHQHIKQCSVSIPVARVVVASRQLGGVRLREEPPVHASQLCAQLTGRLKLEHHMPVCLLQKEQLPWFTFS